MQKSINKIVRNVSFLTLFLFGSLFLHAGNLEIDKSHSQVGFSIKHLMISNVKGKFNDYSGEIDFDLNKKAFTKFNATVQATSIYTGIKKRDNHLRSADFFNVNKFPVITYKMNSYLNDGDEGTLNGELTINNVTKPVKLNVEYNGMVKDPWGKTKVGFTITGKINRKDFGLTWNKALEAGGVVVGDRVKILIELQALVK